MVALQPLNADDLIEYTGSRVVVSADVAPTTCLQRMGKMADRAHSTGCVTAWGAAMEGIDLPFLPGR